MKRLKLLALATVASAAALSAQALATPTSFMGVTFDPTGANFQSSQLVENAVGGPGSELSGWGQITAINGNTGFCSGCQLTYTFSGYTVIRNDSGEIDFTGGLINFFVDSGTAYSGFDESTASDGDLFLTAAGHTIQGTDAFAGRMGTLLSNVTGIGTNAFKGSGVGELDVAGGPAGHFFDRNNIADGLGTFADFNFTTDFGAAGCSSTTDQPICGSASLFDRATAVPEPGALGLMGFGLIAMGFFARRPRRKD